MERDLVAVSDKDETIEDNKELVALRFRA